MVYTKPPYNASEDMKLRICSTKKPPLPCRIPLNGSTISMEIDLIFHSNSITGKSIPIRPIMRTCRLRYRKGGAGQH